MGDVFLRVVRPHLLLVDVFLEDVANYVRVYFVVFAQRPVIEVPLVLIEEVEERCKCGIRNIDLLVRFLELVNLEKAAVEIRNVAEECAERGVKLAVGPAFAEPVVKQPQEEVAKERLEAVAASGLAYSLQSIP